MKYDDQTFERDFGRPPHNDDLDRVNCDTVGEAGHHQCGICLEHKKPRFMCGCYTPF